MVTDHHHPRLVCYKLAEWSWCPCTSVPIVGIGLQCWIVSTSTGFYLACTRRFPTGLRDVAENFGAEGILFTGHHYTLNRKNVIILNLSPRRIVGIRRWWIQELHHTLIASYSWTPVNHGQTGLVAVSNQYKQSQIISGHSKFVFA